VETDSPPSRFEFDSTDELLKYLEPRKQLFKEFSHFAIEDNCVMAISENGFHWWVLGMVSSPVNLPQWDHGMYACKDGDIAIDVPGTQVIWSAGDDVCLKDGRMLKRRGR
jgi:hypothetical protein